MGTEDMIIDYLLIKQIDKKLTKQVLSTGQSGQAVSRKKIMAFILTILVLT